jgi:hypothetical protein
MKGMLGFLRTREMKGALITRLYGMVMETLCVCGEHCVKEEVT